MIQHPNHSNQPDKPTKTAHQHTTSKSNTSFMQQAPTLPMTRPLQSGHLSELSPPGPEKGPDFSSALQAEPSVTRSDFGMDHFRGYSSQFSGWGTTFPSM